MNLQDTIQLKDEQLKQLELKAKALLKKNAELESFLAVSHYRNATLEKDMNNMVCSECGSKLSTKSASVTKSKRVVEEPTPDFWLEYRKGIGAQS